MIELKCECADPIKVRTFNIHQRVIACAVCRKVLEYECMSELCHNYTASKKPYCNECIELANEFERAYKEITQ